MKRIILLIVTLLFIVFPISISASELSTESFVMQESDAVTGSDSRESIENTEDTDHEAISLDAVPHLSSATVSNIAIPTPGMKVEEYVDTTTRPEADAEKYSVLNSECYWSGKYKRELLPSNAFALNTEYYYSVTLKANGDYVFDQDATLNITGKKVEPYYERRIVNAGKEITFVCAYKVTCVSGQIQTIAEVSLSDDDFYYNGKVQKPQKNKLIVKDSNGNVIPSTDFDVEYSKPRPKKVGVYTVTVTGNGSVSGTASTIFKINPSVPRSVRVSAGSKSVKVKWSKPKSGKPDYYDVFVYKDSACKDIFTSARLAKTSKTIVGLRSGMTYYVKVDCFVRSDAGYLVSKPSGAKAVTVK